MEGRGTLGHQPLSATYVQRTVLPARAGGRRGCRSKPPPRGRCQAHAQGLEVLAPISPQGHTSPRLSWRWRPGALRAYLDRMRGPGTTKGMWTDQSFVAARRSGLGLSFREWVGGSNPQPALKGDSVGKCLGGAWDGGTQGRSPSPQATADSWRLPASRAGSQWVLLCSAARERLLRRREPGREGTGSGGSL